MINIENYTKIIDASKFIKYIFLICFICIMINFTISILDKNNKNEDEDEKEKKDTNNNFNIIEKIGAITICIIIVILFPCYIKLVKYIYILAIPSIFLIIYTTYIKPMVNDKPQKFIFKHYEYGSLLIYTLYYFINKNYTNLFNKITSEGKIQILCIIILLFEIYCSIYCILVNLYFVIKNLKKIKIEKIKLKYVNTIKKVYSKYGIDNIVVHYNNCNKLMYKNKLIKKIFLIIPYFIIDTILTMTKLIISIILSFIITPIFSFINSFFTILIKITYTNENQINFALSKIVTTFSIIYVYIVLQMNEIFQQRIINTYEFISSVIIIPIVLDALITIKDKLKK